MSAAVTIPAETQNTPHESLFQIRKRQFMSHRLAVAGLAILIVFILMAVFADLIAKVLHQDPFAGEILSRYSPPSPAHWLGTDEAGRDILVRIIYGARVSLGVAFLSAMSAAAIGILIGSLAGYLGGIWDSLLMRVTDSLLALPTLPILILLAAVDLQKIPWVGSAIDPSTASLAKLVFILVVFSWMTIARLMRGAVLSLKEREFVLASSLSGAGPLHILLKEVLPNALSPVIVAATVNMGQSILYEAALSYLGLGIQPPTPSWGNMLTQAREALNAMPLLAIVPGLMILLLVMSFNFVGDGLRDALDARAVRRG